MNWNFYLYFGVYLVVLFGVVLWFGKNESDEDFLISGRNRTTWQILLSKFAGTMGVSWFITYMAFAYEFGVAMLAFLPGIVIGYLVFAYWGIPRIYKHSRQGKFYTQGDYIYHRTKSMFAKTATELSAVFVQFGWLVAIIIGGGIVMSTYGFLSFELAVMITTGVVLLYILFAGFRAVIMTDVIQSLIILVLVSILVVVVLRDVSLPEVLSIETASLSPGEVAAFFIFSLLTMFGQADRFQLVYASRNEKTATRGVGLAFLPVFFIAAFLLVAGLFVRSQLPGIDPSTAFPELLTAVLPAALLPFGLILFFAGLMSSADTYTFSIASHVSFVRKTSHPVRTMRIAIVAALVLCAALAILVGDIVDMSILAATLTVAVSLPTIAVIAGVRLASVYLATLIMGLVGFLGGIVVLGIDLKIIGTVLVGGLLGLFGSLLFCSLKKRISSSTHKLAQSKKSMKIQNNIQLKKFNTFGIDVAAKYFAEISSISDFQELAQTGIFKQESKLFLGGGSNVLFTQDFDGLVIKNNLKGIELLQENEQGVVVKVMSGENWHEFVMHAVEQGWGGVENLALIPGSVGATPVQNIGAYGVELKDTLESVEAIDLATGETVEFSAEACKFGYRDSIFKHEAKGKYFITAVIFKLSKEHEIKTEYGAIQKILEENNVSNPSIRDIADAVIEIRSNKLPNPVQIGNAGSFFKNPVVERSVFETLQSKNPDIPFYELDNSRVKIPAAWLIEQCGWKGKRVGNTGSHERQALVLVNYGEATGVEIKQLAEDIQHSVQEKFGIGLEMEVTII